MSISKISNQPHPPWPKWGGSASRPTKTVLLNDQQSLESVPIRYRPEVR